MKYALTILIFLISLSFVNGQSVIRGPYLQKPTPTSMVIKWRTNTPTQSKIEYGTNRANLSQVVNSETLVTEHELLISDLSPGTVYYYSLLDATKTLKSSTTDLYFKTPPVPGSTPDIKLWVLGDCGTANANQRAVRNAYYNYIEGEHTDAILLLGDNAYESGTDEEYQRAIFEGMYEDKLQNTIVWSCLGNHDGYTADSRSQTGPYYDIFSFPTRGESGGLASGTEAYYSFDYGNIHFIALDSYETDTRVGGAMYNWCEQDIQNTTQEWIVAFWHHPPYSKGSHDSDSEGRLVDMRRNFLPMLEQNGIDLVLSGHSHSYERSYFLNGHYDFSNTFDSRVHTIGKNGFGDGRADGDGAYYKGITESRPNDGAVYVTTGTSGRISGGPINHPAIFYGVQRLGSCSIEVSGSEMTVKFIRETGTVDDYFTINKGEDTCQIGELCDDGDDCTINDLIDQDCDCLGTFQDTEDCQTNPIVGHLQLKLLLEGMYDPVKNEMTDHLRTNNLIPLKQPFGGAPWFYEGQESVTEIPENAIDWILIGIRDEDNNIIGEAAGFISKDGELLELNGGTGLVLPSLWGNYISVHHRSHIAVISNEVYRNQLFDFTNSHAAAKGGDQLKFMNGRYVLFAGDFDANGIVNNFDYNEWRNHYYQLGHYLSYDGDGNGIVNNQDYNLWVNNRAKIGYTGVQY